MLKSLLMMELALEGSEEPIVLFMTTRMPMQTMLTFLLLRLSAAVIEPLPKYSQKTNCRDSHYLHPARI